MVLHILTGNKKNNLDYLKCFLVYAYLTFPLLYELCYNLFFKLKTHNILFLFVKIKNFNNIVSCWIVFEIEFM
jgi:hypothetical protein